MAGIQKIEVDTELKINAQKAYHIIKHDLHHLPKIYPEAYKESEIIHGDGTRNGCIRTWKYVLPGTNEVVLVKCKNEDLEDEKMTIALKAIEGSDLLKEFKSILARVTVIPKGKGCVVKWAVEYEKLNDNVADPHKYLEMFDMLNKKLEAHLLQSE